MPGQNDLIVWIDHGLFRGATEEVFGITGKVLFQRVFARYNDNGGLLLCAAHTPSALQGRHDRARVAHKNADSMQIYKNLDVGTAKPSAEERQGIPHYLLDFLPPETPYSVADFTAAADPLIRDITARGRLPLVVGGTGLYITSLLSGMAFAPEKTDPAIRARLQARADTEGGAALYAELQRVDPDYAAQVHPNNLPRVIRALELFEATGRRMSDQRREARPAEAPYHALCLCLTCRDRAVLYSRIDRRVDEMVENSVLDEARQVYDHRDAYRTAAQAIGYKEFFPYFEGTADLTECTERLKQATRNYAKRQLTWFTASPLALV